MDVMGWDIPGFLGFKNWMGARCTHPPFHSQVFVPNSLDQWPTGALWILCRKRTTLRLGEFSHRTSWGLDKGWSCNTIYVMPSEPGWFFQNMMNMHRYCIYGSVYPLYLHMYAACVYTWNPFVLCFATKRSSNFQSKEGSFGLEVCVYIYIYLHLYLRILEWVVRKSTSLIL